MQLTRLIIKKLYGCYDYDVHFNSDVTFLFGLNGCGKTTVLNIIEAIITGSVFNLFQYKFKSISLSYVDENSLLQNILIDTTGKNGLAIKFQEKMYHILEMYFSDDEERMRLGKKEYYRKYRVLQVIRKTFKHVYLPLNRTDTSDEMDDYRYFLARRMHGIDRRGEQSQQVITSVSSLIRDNYSEISAKIANVNDTFRKNILKSLLELNEPNDFESEFTKTFGHKDTLSYLANFQTAYLKMLNELELLTKDEEQKYNDFFATFIYDLKHFSPQNQDQNTAERLLQKLKEFIRIRKILEISEETDQVKDKIRAPLALFLEIMNSFIYNQYDEKMIQINDLGETYFITKYNREPVSIKNLSSGEKQLLTFFANLIFRVGRDEKSIFIVDEPELSLHLAWQKDFVDKALEVNPNIQLIFATHSPEFIGRRRDKMFELKKQCTGDRKDNE